MKKLLLLFFVSIFGFANEQTILFLGDSLTEGYGLAKSQAYPALVEKLFKTELNKDIKVINGGVSGSTTSDAVARLKWYLKQKPQIIFIALGANDGLRGLDLNQSQKNLETIINLALEAKAKVVLAKMLMPPNYGPDYTKAFSQMYENLKTKFNLPMMPFLLEGVAGKKEFNQSDGIHPNKKGHEIIAKNVFEFLKKSL